MFQQRHIVDAVVFGVSNFIDKAADGLRGVATATHSTQGGHAGIVPSRHQLLLHQLQQPTLAHHCVRKVQAVEFCLSGTIIAVCQLVDEPVVERPVHFKLQSTQRMGHPLEVVRLPVGKVVHWISLPGGSGTVVRYMDYPIDDGIPEVHV